MSEQIEWSKDVRIGRCGEDRYGQMDTRFCGETLHFREAKTELGRWRESICPICSLKWDIMACTSYPERDKLCRELAEIMHVDAASAYRMARRSFWFDYSLRKAVKEQTGKVMGRVARSVPVRTPYPEYE